MKKVAVLTAVLVGVTVLVVAALAVKTSDEIYEYVQQEAAVLSVGHELLEILTEARLEDSSFRSTELSDDQLADYINKAKDRSVSLSLGELDEDAVAARRSVTFTQRKGDTFQLVSGDGSIAAIVTLYGDLEAGAYFTLDRRDGALSGG